MKVLLALSCLVMVNAQFTPNLPPSCVPEDVQAGTGAFLTHDKFCQLFYQCNLLNAFEQPCNAGMLFNNIANRCASPTETNIDKSGFCQNWQCNGQKYPDTCCNKYWTCSSATGQNIWTRNICNGNDNFNMAQGRCEQSSRCVDHARCNNPRTASGATYTCRLSAIVNQPCMYLDNDAGIAMSCAAGTEFDSTICACGHAKNLACKADNLGQNKLPDQDCKVSYRTNFAFGTYGAASDKVETGNLWRNVIRHELTSIANGEVIFPGAGSLLSVPYYMGNQFMAPVVFSMTFALSNNQQQSIPLITNGLPVASQCEKTFSVDAVTSSYQLKFDIYVQDASNKKDTFTVTTTVQTSNNNNVYTNWIKLNIAFTGRRMVAEAFDLGQSNQVPQSSNGRSVGTGSSNLEFGIQMKTGNCGITLGQNLNGKIREFAVYEGCQLSDPRNPVKFFTNYITQMQG